MWVRFESVLPQFFLFPYFDPHLHRYFAHYSYLLTFDTPMQLYILVKLFLKCELSQILTTFCFSRSAKNLESKSLLLFWEDWGWYLRVITRLSENLGLRDFFPEKWQKRNFVNCSLVSLNQFQCQIFRSNVLV